MSTTPTTTPPPPQTDGATAHGTCRERVDHADTTTTTTADATASSHVSYPGGNVHIDVTALKGTLSSTCASVQGKPLHAGQSARLPLGGTLRFLHQDPATEFRLVCPTHHNTEVTMADPIQLAQRVLLSSGGGHGQQQGPAATTDGTMHSTASASDSHMASIMATHATDGRGQQPPDVIRKESAVPKATTHPLMLPGRSVSTKSAAAVQSRATGGPGRPSWFTALNGYVNHPDRHANTIVFRDDQCTVIKDMYPKAATHWLVLPNRYISDLSQLQSTDLPLLTHMVAVAKQLEAHACARDPTLMFREGMHAIPSMDRVHVHVVSQDFNSPCLKNKYVCCALRMCCGM